MIISLSAGNDRYCAFIKKGILNHLDEHLDFSKQILFVIDENIDAHFYDKFVKNKFIYKIIASEKSKSMENVMRILDLLCENHFAKDDYIISLGGGITSDLVGFAASIYKRGINWISIPTTTLAMIDASVGGKTAVNFHGIKNQIGNFYFPIKVLIDLNVLTTLDERNFNNGLCEALKMGITLDKTIVELLYDPQKNLSKIISKSIKSKNKIVKQDLKDKNIRHVLNYGHTIGHALEMIDEDLLHGEAILLGMYYVSSAKIKNIILDFIQRFKIKNKSFDFDCIKRYLIQDKKIEDNQMKLVFVNDYLDYKIQDLTLDELKIIYEEGKYGKCNW